MEKEKQMHPVKSLKMMALYVVGFIFFALVLAEFGNVVRNLP